MGLRTVASLLPGIAIHFIGVSIATRHESTHVCKFVRLLSSASEDVAGEGHERLGLPEGRLQVLARDVEKPVVGLILEIE